VLGRKELGERERGKRDEGGFGWKWK